jgi:2-phospho-L-lactate guanylyltransferase
MKTLAIVPVKRFECGKSRLGAVLRPDERISLCELLLMNTIKILEQSSTIYSTVVVSSEKSAVDIAQKCGAKFLKLECDKGVNEAVDSADELSSLIGADATVVIPQDVPLLASSDINRLCIKAEQFAKCIVICPSIRYDGTNALLRKPPTIMRTFYDEDSFNSHVRAAILADVPIRFLLSRKMMKDLDSVEDIRILMKEEVLNIPLSFLRSKLRDEFLMNIKSAM